MPDRPETGCHKSTSTARNGLMNLLNSPSLALKQQSSSLIVIIALLDIFKEKKGTKDFMRAISGHLKTEGMLHFI